MGALAQLILRRPLRNFLALVQTATAACLTFLAAPHLVSQGRVLDSALIWASKLATKTAMAILQRGLGVQALLMGNLVCVLDRQQMHQANQDCPHPKDRTKVIKATVVTWASRCTVSKVRSTVLIQVDITNTQVKTNKLAAMVAMAVAMEAALTAATAVDGAPTMDTDSVPVRQIVANAVSVSNVFQWCLISFVFQGFESN